MARVASAILNTSYSDRPQRNKRRSMSRRAGLMMRSERNCRNWSGVQDAWPWVYRPTVVLKRGSTKRTERSGATRPTTSSFHLRYRKAASIGVSFRARTLHYARLSPKSGHPRPKPYPRQKKTPPEGRVGKFMERATGLEPANTSLGSYFHPELHFRENRSSPAKSLLEFSAWREVRQKVRQISTVFKTGHLQEKNRRAPTNADALR